MSNFITDDVCEDVTICDPNEIVQDCLPGGEELECLYTIDLRVPWETKHFYLNADMIGYDKWGWGWWPEYQDLEFLVDKVVKTGDTGIQQEVWLAKAEGGDFGDYLSGIGLLEWIRDTQGDAVAQVEPSVLLGDLIHFELDGGAGDDFVQGANNADVLSGGAGDDEVRGEGGDDNISGDGGNDELYGDGGNDIISGGDGNDYARGGTGNDEITGGFGDDDLFGDDGNDNLTGGDGDDLLDGGNGDDWMSGGADDDDIYGGAGADCADGGDGDDYISMGSGNDRALGGAGDDEMYGGTGNDKLDGGDGDDHVYGDDGNDLVVGGAGDDRVEGGKGDDIVRGGIGEDELWGGEGCDVFAFCEISYNCQDVIKDFSAGYDPDQIDLSQLEIDELRVVETGFDEMVRFDVLVGGETVQRILVDNMDNANLRSVFEKDTAYGTDDAALVKIGEGVRVDLPSTSLMVVDDGLFF